MFFFLPCLKERERRKEKQRASIALHTTAVRGGGDKCSAINCCTYYNYYLLFTIFFFSLLHRGMPDILQWTAPSHMLCLLFRKESNIISSRVSVEEGRASIFFLS